MIELVKKIIRILCVVLWMALIFWFSSKSGSESADSSHEVLNLFYKGVLNKEIIHYYFRKLAHVFVYAILGILLERCIHDYSRHSLMLSLFLVFLYALSDEIHQYFVPGRSMQLMDILIDTISGFVFSFLHLFILKKMK